MRCLHPSVIHPSEGGTLVVPCNRCIACRINKTEEWSTRLLFEYEKHGVGAFVTLTYDDEHLPSDGSLHKDHIQKFIKRVRKHYAGNGASEIKYYLCGEYGPTTFRPHYHIAIFGVDFEMENWIQYKSKHYYSPTLLELWPFGFNEVGFLNKTTMNYVTGYIQKKLFGEEAALYKKLNVIPPFQLFSKKLGVEFVQKHGSQFVNNMCITVQGKKMPISKYYSGKLGLSDLKTDEGFSVLQMKALEEAAKRRAKHPELSAIDFNEYEHLVRVQRENDLKGKEALRPSRSKL